VSLTRDWNDTAGKDGERLPVRPEVRGGAVERHARWRRVQLVLLNTFSLSRLGMAVAFPFEDSAGGRVGLIVAAGLSDFLDGWIARHAHLTSRTGALVDPLADRAFVVTAFTTYLVEGSLSPLAYATLLVRDAATALGYLVARIVPSMRRVEFKARLAGKLVTTLQLAALLAVPVVPAAVVPLVLLTGLFSVLSVADYTRYLWRARAV
jgi:phosphatidylglycerophosphate synthase